MTSNPYIIQHYGRSMDVLSNGSDADEMPDAAIGFSRFPNATHMTHTVFRPKRGPPVPVTAAASPPSMPGNGVYVAETPDVLAIMRQRKGIPVDGFPSRPLTPRGSSSANSLPPLLPADRLSIASRESPRDRGAGLMREWVKAPSDAAAVATATHTNDNNRPAETSRNPLPVHIAASNGELLASQPSSQPATSAGRHPETLPPPEAPPAAEPSSSISVSSESPRLGLSPRMTGPSTPVPAPEPPVHVVAVSVALQRSRDALAQVEQLLDDAPIPGGSRTLPPPPPLPPPSSSGQQQPSQQLQRPSGSATLPAPSSTQTRQDEDSSDSPEDSMDYLSPLSSSHVRLHTFPAPEHRSAVLAAAPPAHSANRKATAAPTVAVPDETRFMVLCPVADPAEMVARRLRARGPPAAGPGDDGGGTTSAGSPAPSQPARRIAEVSATRQPHLAARAPHESTATQRPAPSFSVSHSGVDGPAPIPAQPSASRLLQEDSSLLHELADFLRSANPSGFSSLKAATQAAAGVAASTSRATPPAAPLRDRRRSSPAAAFPTPTVLAGRPPPTSLLPQRQSSTTAPSQLADAGTPTSPALHLPTDGSATHAEVSPRRASLRVRHVDSLPSYAQPTLSWLSKGTEAAADVFPTGLVPPPQLSPLRDESAVTLEAQGSHSSLAAS